MKYIRLYEEIELLSDNIKDILLEIVHLGYKYSMYQQGIYKYISIAKDHDIFTEPLFIKFDEVKDCVLRLKDFLGDKYVGCEIHSKHLSGKVELNDKIDLGYRKIYILYILYKTKDNYL